MRREGLGWARLSRQSRLRIVALAAVAACSSPLVGSAQAGPVRGVTTTTVVDGRVAPPRPKAAIPVAGPLDALEARAKSRFPGDYAGVAPGSVFVRQADASTGAPGIRAADLPASLDGVAVRPVRFSRAELQAFKDQLDAAAAAGVVADVGLARWGVDVESNSLSVDVVGDPVAAKAALVSALAPAKDARGVPLSVTEVSDFPTPASRDWSYPPHYGGARIYNSTYGTCTSGLPWVKNGAGQITTAGHCGLSGSTWNTNAGPFGAMVFNGRTRVGSARVDLAVMNHIPADSGAPYFYVGPPGSNGVVHQGFYYPGGQTGVTGLRTSGAISGERFRGNGAVLLTEQSVNYPNQGGYYYHLNYGECHVQAGDSGGPVFVVTSTGDIIAAGIISGWYSSDEPGSGRCLYMPVNQIIAAYGGTPMA